jgi:hypothetical protein
VNGSLASTRGLSNLVCGTKIVRPRGSLTRAAATLAMARSRLTAARAVARPRALAARSARNCAPTERPSESCFDFILALRLCSATAPAWATRARSSAARRRSRSARSRERLSRSVARSRSHSVFAAEIGPGQRVSSPSSMRSVAAVSASSRARSCETTTAMPRNMESAAESSWVPSASRWFWGSSSKSTSGASKMALPSCQRRRSPGESGAPSLPGSSRSAARSRVPSREVVSASAPTFSESTWAACSTRRTRRSPGANAT